MHILITGGAGFIGSALSESLLAKGHKVTSLDLAKSKVNGVKSIKTDITQELSSDLFEGVDGIIHLAGRSIFGKWDEAYKQSIYDSRIKSAEQMYKAIESLEKKPQFFFSASAIGYYGDRPGEVLNEFSEPGTSFLAGVVQDWERSALSFQKLGLRTLSFRHGHVLGKRGLVGVLLPYYKAGIGGPIGKGNYAFSWISLNDLLNLYEQAIEDISINGVINAVCKEPVLYKQFSKQLAKAVHRPHLLFIPKFVLALLYSAEFVQEITSSQKVVSESDFVQTHCKEHSLQNVLNEIVQTN